MFTTSDRDNRPGSPLLKRTSRSPTPDIERGRAPHGPSKLPRRSPSQASDPSTPSSPILARPSLSRRSTLRSRSPATNARVTARKKYTYAAFFLLLSLVSFTVQTELAAWVQHAGWAKPYCMLYLTHGSWSLLWPVQLLVLRLQKRSLPWAHFWRRHVWLVRSTAQMVELRRLDVPAAAAAHRPVRYMARTTAFVTAALTVAGLSWYVAVNLTSPSDLTAIYNCSAFFAYAFSVPLLGERVRAGKSAAVAIAILGVLVVAYGDAKVVDRAPGTGEDDPPPPAASARWQGNLIIGAGSVLYGLYEVLYKRFACPPDGCSPGRGMVFANTFGSLIGVFTLCVLWIPLPLLHVTGLEVFELPADARVAWYLFLSVVMNATFAGSFLVLISLTSPVLGSVANLLTIFIVAVADWVLTGEPLSFAAVLGGGMIIVAFFMLSWSSYREMAEDEMEKQVDLSDEDDGDEESDQSDGIDDARTMTWGR